MDLLLRRFANERLVNSPFKSPRDVVEWFGAMQAQDWYASNWAVGMRIPGATEKDIEDAINSKKIIKTWAMRGTLHYVLPEDYRWMLKLFAPRILPKHRPYHRSSGLSEEILDKSVKLFLKELKGKQLTREELRKLLNKVGIKTNDMRGMFIVGYAVYKGAICWAQRKGKQFTFALVEDWIPKGRELSHDEARIELARRYFRSHGPATIKDYVWWSSLTVKDAKFALEHLKNEIVAEEFDGKTFYGPKKQPPIKKGMTDLIPVYDEFTVAFKDRENFYDKKYSKRVIMGLGYVIVRDGRVIGVWKRTTKGDKITLELDVFEGKVDKGVLDAAKRYERFLGKKIEIRK